MRIILRALVLSVFITSLHACSVINPYSSKFSCPDQDSGKCQSIKENYLESLHGVQVEEEGREGEYECGENCPDDEEEGIRQGRVARATYQDMMLDRFEDLLAQPKAPMVMPAQAMRVLVLPYRGKDGHLFMERYIYLFVEEPKWLLEDVR